MSTKRKAEDQEEVTKKAKKVEEVVAEEEVNKSIFNAVIFELIEAQEGRWVKNYEFVSFFILFFYQVLVLTIIHHCFHE